MGRKKIIKEVIEPQLLPEPEPDQRDSLKQLTSVQALVFRTKRPGGLRRYQRTSHKRPLIISQGLCARV